MSGDVHFGEFLGLDNDEYGGLMEVTSSGLTHTCTTPFLYGFACPYILHKFQNHRTSENFYFTDKNFGTIDFDWEAILLVSLCETKMVSRVFSSHTSNVIISNKCTILMQFINILNN